MPSSLFLPIVLLLIVSRLTRGSNAILLNSLLLERQDQAQATLANATCETGYEWADDGAGMSPCVMAAGLAACNMGNHTVPPLTPGEHYDPPSLNNESVNVCQCSWAVYNLISMCTACQGQSNSVILWASYSVECQGFTESDSYFPSNVPVNITIPLYAQSNPTQWVNGVFNVTQAKQIAQGTIVLSTSTESRSSKPIGTIVGASLGGAVFLLCLIGVAIWLRHFHRRKYVQLHNTPPTRHSAIPPYTRLYSSNSEEYPVSFGDHNHSLVRSDRNEYVSADQEEWYRTPDSQIGSPNLLLPIPFRLKYDNAPLVQSTDNTHAQRPTTHDRRKTAPSAVNTQNDYLREQRVGHYSAPPGVISHNASMPNNGAAGRNRAVPVGMSNGRRPSSPPPYSSPHLG
ncbi:hypothetical protein BT96DRAFT_1015720 [Gymnopus androsaceus JB14]|uniref:Uncharacterized protein n=1 Tax=Gymnopus androsaceus JB14 TaxID=1447944 RepID=A0A6A4I899_9AGAR|nr:hypothetical protein BT96DRAFT_1015720 [Gymnopus androsaceus JB14]